MLVMKVAEDYEQEIVKTHEEFEVMLDKKDKVIAEIKNEKAKTDAINVEL